MLSGVKSRQQGMVLLVSLVVLVVLALASVALLRSVSTSNIIAGNLAFQQAATSSADQATEVAIAWLESTSGKAAATNANTCAVGTTVLACNQDGHGYLASRQDPDSTQSWPDLWAALKAAGHAPASVNNGAADKAGNTMAYFIQRMCSADGDVSIANGCSISPTSSDMSSKGGGGGGNSGGNLNSPSQAYYRITVQVNGPRNTVSYTQAMVAL